MLCFLLFFVLFFIISSSSITSVSVVFPLGLFVSWALSVPLLSVKTHAVYLLLAPLSFSLKVPVMSCDSFASCLPFPTSLVVFTCW